MPLTLEAEPGLPTSNSYADVAAADTAATYRIGANAAAWTAITDSELKIKALVSATAEIDSIGEVQENGFLISFPGEKTNEDQALEWPRGDDTELPADLVKATIELALTYAPTLKTGYKGPDPLNPDASTGRLKRSKLDVIEKEWFAPGPAATSLDRLPGIVRRLLEKLLVYTQISGQWGSGSAVRGS